MTIDRRFAYETNNYSPGLAGFYDPQPSVWPRLEDQFQAAAAAGFGWIVIDAGSLGAFLKNGARLGRLRELLDGAGLRCLALSEVAIVEEREAVFEDARLLIDGARALAAPFVQASVMGVAAACHESARALEQLAAAAGATLALEFMPFSRIDSIAAALAFVDRAQLCNTRLVVDSWHFFQGGPDWAQLAALRPAAIAYLQLSDHAAIGVADPLHATVNERVMPGEGVFDMARFCETLRLAGFRGVASVEVLSGTWRQRSPRDYAQAELEAVRALWPEGARARHDLLADFLQDSSTRAQR